MHLQQTTTPVPNVRPALDEAVKAGWLSADESAALQARLGDDGLAGFADVVLNGLKKPVLLSAAAWAVGKRDEMAGSVTPATVLLLPDAAQVKRRIDSYLAELLDGLSAWVGPTGQQAGEIVSAIRQRVPNVLGTAYSASKSSGGLEPDAMEVETVASTIESGSRPSLAAIVDALEQAVAGSLAAIMKLLGIEGRQLQPWDFSAYAPAAFAGQARPSFSVIEQASAVCLLSSQGSSLQLGPVTAALVPGVSGVTTLGGVPGAGGDGYQAAYKASLGWLRGLGMTGVAYGVLVDLAHLLALAALEPPQHDGLVKPAVLTGDWAVIETLGMQAGIDMRARRPDETFYAFFNRVQKPLPFQVKVPTSGLINVYPIDAPRNPTLPLTQMRQLAQLSDPPRVCYGTQVRLRPGQPGEQTAYVYGYDTAGHPKVLWSDGETLQLLDSVTQVEVVSKDGRLSFTSVDPQTGASSQAEMPSVGPHPSFPWLRAELTIEDVAKKTPELGEGAKNLAALLDRPVAEHPELKIKDYTGIITSSGFDVFIVGGAVRDVLLGANPNDIDLASTMPAPDTYQAIITDPRGLGKKGGKGGEMQVRKNLPFGTVQVEPTKVTGLDIIAAHGLHHGSSLSVDLDAYARDFTINTVYYNPVTKKVIDPTGMGLIDLSRRRLRFILALEPIIVGKEHRILDHDLVLIGRWIKFVAKKFEPVPGDLGKVLASLEYHLQTGVDDLARAKFIDRSGLSPRDLVAKATEIRGDLGKYVQAIVYPNMK